MGRGGEQASGASLLVDDDERPWVDHEEDDHLDASRQAEVWVYLGSDIERAQLWDETGMFFDRRKQHGKVLSSKMSHLTPPSNVNVKNMAQQTSESEKVFFSFGLKDTVRVRHTEMSTTSSFQCHRRDVKLFCIEWVEDTGT